MPTRRLCAFIVILGVILAVASQAEDGTHTKRKSKKPKEHPQPAVVDQDRIDKACAACIARDYSTAGMLRCAQVELLQREHELEEVYGELFDKLTERFGDDVKSAFLDSQKRWEKYRDSQFKLIDKMYAKIDGTMFLPMRIAEKSDVVKKRTIELRETLNLLKFAFVRGETRKSSSGE